MEEDNIQYSNVQRRYKVVEGSASAHCCFTHTVVDTAYEGSNFDCSICECFNEEDANDIAERMNANPQPVEE